MVFARSCNKLKNNISTTTVLKRDSMVTNLERLQRIMLLYPLVTWYCKITWQMKTILSPLPRYVRSPNLVEWRLTVSVLYPSFYSTLWSRGLPKLYDKLKKYLHYHDAYDHQIQQGCHLPWGGSTHKVTWPLDHETNQNHYISTTLVVVWLTIRGSHP